MRIELIYNPIEEKVKQNDTNKKIYDSKKNG
jgi:hypothetical protein